MRLFQCGRTVCLFEIHVCLTVTELRGTYCVPMSNLLCAFPRTNVSSLLIYIHICVCSILRLTRCHLSMRLCCVPFCWTEFHFVFSVFLSKSRKCRFHGFFLKIFSNASSKGNFLSYEETEILRNASFFEGFGFYKAKDILKLCKELDDDPYGKVPESAKSGDDEDIIAKRNKTTQKLTPSERRNLNKHAAILIMADNRKATSMADFIKEKFDKQMVEVEDLETNNCLFESTPKQISNVKYITNMATGSTFKTTGLETSVHVYSSHRS